MTDIQIGGARRARPRGAQLARARDKLNDGHGRAVAAPEARAQDARVAARAVRVPRRQHGEELRHEVGAAQVRVRAHVRRVPARLGPRHGALRVRAHLLRLGQRRADALVPHERRHELAARGRTRGRGGRAGG